MLSEGIMKAIALATQGEVTGKSRRQGDGGIWSESAKVTGQS